MASIVVSGDTSGAVTLSAPSVAGTTTVTLPSSTGTMALLQTPSFATTIGVGGATASASGSGISFPATQSASSDANTLDDYEEGTWTPSVIGSATNPTISYSSRTGRYTKIGRIVYCEFDLTISSESGGSGDVYIGSLPFTKTSDAPAFSGDMSMIRGGRTTALGGVSATRIAFAFAGTVLTGSTSLELGYTNNSTGAGESYSISDLTTGRIVGSFQYCV